MRKSDIKVKMPIRQAEALLQLAGETDFDTFDMHGSQSYRWRVSGELALEKLAAAIRKVERRDQAGQA